MSITNKHIGIRVGAVIGFCIVAALLFALMYALRVQGAAEALVQSARKIQSTQDAEREVEAWEKRSDRRFIKEQSTDGQEQSFIFQVENVRLAHFLIVRPSVVELVINYRHGVLNRVTVVMFQGRRPENTAGVWIQEWFGTAMADDFHVNEKDRPLKAVVEFSSSAAERSKAFALNTKCFLPLARCNRAEEILPGVWQLSPELKNDR